MTKNIHLIQVIAAMAVVLLTLASPALAGQKLEADVAIDFGARTASGAIGTAGRARARARPLAANRR